MDNDKFKKKMVKIVSDVISEYFEQHNDSLKIPIVFNSREEIRMIGYASAILGNIHTLFAPALNKCGAEGSLCDIMGKIVDESVCIEYIKVEFDEFYKTIHPFISDEEWEEGDSKLEFIAESVRDTLRLKTRSEAIKKAELFQQMIIKEKTKDDDKKHWNVDPI